MGALARPDPFERGGGQPLRGSHGMDGDGQAGDVERGLGRGPAGAGAPRIDLRRTYRRGLSAVGHSLAGERRSGEYLRNPAYLHRGRTLRRRQLRLHLHAHALVSQRRIHLRRRSDPGTGQFGDDLDGPAPQPLLLQLPHAPQRQRPPHEPQPGLGIRRTGVRQCPDRGRARSSGVRAWTTSPIRTTRASSAMPTPC